MTHDHDVVVIGSGFGGSVAALRLTEKGYRVAVLEAGRRFAPRDFARTSWNLRRWLYVPRLGLRGIQRLTLLDDALVLSGAGVGGGSLVYANVLAEPLEPFWDDPAWAGIADWRTELEPHFETARRMLGAVPVPWETAADRLVGRIAERMGVADTYRRVVVGEPAPRLQDGDAVALLGQAERGNAATEPGADDDDIEVTGEFTHEPESRRYFR